VAEHAGPLSAEQVATLAMSHIDTRLLRPVAADAGEAGDSEAVVQPVASPEERLGLALEEIRRAVVAELLDTLATVTPAFFETLVLDLLHRMGYGANRADLQRVGGSGDAGIDGIISLDRLGLEKVYVQAKRWQGTVGRPEIQAFYGALAGQRAKKGVFITTSGYTAQALQFAQSVEGIVLYRKLRIIFLRQRCWQAIS
jgi:restriction system protein